MAKASSASRSGLKKEILGIVFLALAVLLALSLFSFNPDDPSFNNRISGPSKATNLAGFIGAHLADVFFQTFGLSAFLWPVFFALFALKFFQVLKLAFPPAKTAAFIGVFITVSSLLSLSLGKRNILGGIFDSGGALGHFGARLATGYLNIIGATLLFTLILILCAMALTNLSVLELSRSGGRLVSAAVDRGRKFWKTRQKKRKEEAKEIQKRTKNPSWPFRQKREDEEKK
ncbi:MAG: hypothetical protein EHM27_17755, partial [Deltaproteobacteria bacterium]